jgi:hypothetical protein
MAKKIFNTSIAIAAVLVLTACSQAPQTVATGNKPETDVKKEPPKPPQPVAAQTAFYEMYKPARSWAPDVLPLSLTNGEVPSIKNEAGKAAVWTAVFVSPGRREARTMSYSVVDEGTFHKGVTVGGAEPWSGATAKSKPFQIAEFVTDSEAAYHVAFEKAQAWVKKHPDKKASLVLGNSSRFPAPVWLVIWGTTKSGYAAYVNAMTGKLVMGK